MTEMVTPAVPMVDVSAENQPLWPQLIDAFGEVLRSGAFILGPHVSAFESEAQRMLGVGHAVGVNSGTDALVIALRALGVGPGDEVVTSPFTFFATAEAVSAVGASPVFADIDPETFTLDPRAAEEAITPATRALLPVHLFGHGANMPALCGVARRYGLVIVEDAAQALGGTWDGRLLGTFGDAAAFSFFPSKNLGGFGDGGLLVTDRTDAAGAARMLRAHGSRRKHVNEMIGCNSRLDEVQAALLRVKLPHLARANEARRAVAARYATLLAGRPGVVLPRARAAAGHVWHQYTVRVAAGLRDRVRESMAASGVATMVYYPVGLHELPVYRDKRAPSSRGPLPNAEAAAREVLSLPIWPGMRPDVQDRVAAALGDALAP